jgi:hypothetical protein
MPDGSECNREMGWAAPEPEGRGHPSPLKPGGLYLGIVQVGAPWRKIAELKGVDRKPRPPETYVFYQQS